MKTHQLRLGMVVRLRNWKFYAVVPVGSSIGILVSIDSDKDPNIPLSEYENETMKHETDKDQDICLVYYKKDEGDFVINTTGYKYKCIYDRYKADKRERIFHTLRSCLGCEVNYSVPEEWLQYTAGRVIDDLEALENRGATS